MEFQDKIQCSAYIQNFILSGISGQNTTVHEPSPLGLLQETFVAMVMDSINITNFRNDVIIEKNFMQ